MEQGMSLPYHKGIALVTVLFITAVGLLFGAGALLLFRFQCQLRVERQHEMEKVYAVRSALNFLRTYTGEIDENTFKYQTGSGRRLGLIVKPVDPIFPDKKYNHFVMEEGRFTIPPSNVVGGYVGNPEDYEYGSLGVTNLTMKNNYEGEYGLAVDDLSATNGVKWWFNLGMRQTGGWLESAYGRRYYFWPRKYVSSNGNYDKVRLCLIRNIYNEKNDDGCKHGWPLSKEGERALVLCLHPNVKDNAAEMILSEYWYSNGTTSFRDCVYMTNNLSDCNIGLQVAENKMSMFYIGNQRKNEVDIGALSSRGYVFSKCVEMSSEMVDYFANEQWIGGIRYDGTNTVNGKLQAPEMRAVFEYEAYSGKRTSCDLLTRFRVTPAYQYDIYLEHPSLTTNLATVAQKTGAFNRYGLTYSLITYDTHGTDNRGFRKDEREAARRQSGQ